MDHRATSETEILNSEPTSAHNYVGGKFSPEMELPKLMWLKKNLPDRWREIKNCFDLADFLTFKCTEELTYSTCTLTCKWFSFEIDSAVFIWPQMTLNIFRILSGLDSKRQKLLERRLGRWISQKYWFNWIKIFGSRKNLISWSTGRNRYSRISFDSDWTYSWHTGSDRHDRCSRRSAWGFSNWRRQRGLW